MLAIPEIRSPRDSREEDRPCQQKMEQLHAPECGARAEPDCRKAGVEDRVLLSTFHFLLLKA